MKHMKTCIGRYLSCECKTKLPRVRNAHSCIHMSKNKPIFCYCFCNPSNSKDAKLAIITQSMQLSKMELFEIYLATLEGCIIFGNMYNDLKNVMGVVPGCAL